MVGYLIAYFFILGSVFSVGRVLQRAIGAESESRRIHGQYVFWWCVGAVAIGGLLGPIHVTFGIFLLAGWLIGTIHGAIVLAVWPLNRQRAAERREP